MYYFSGDATASDFNVENAVGRWFVAKPNYSIMIGKQRMHGTNVKYFTDKNDNPLYYISNDRADTSNCIGGSETT